MLERLEASGFRNWTSLEWDLEPGSHLLLGGTGAGKTSVLEAVYLAATTRSFRASHLSECCQSPLIAGSGHQAGPAAPRFQVRVEVRSVSRSWLEVGWDRQSGSWRLENGSRLSLIEHLSVLPVVLFSAVEGTMLVGEREKRRRFLDRGVVAREPKKLDLLKRYREALRQKRFLLLRGQSGLDSWNQIFASAAHDVVSEREDYLAALQLELNRHAKRLGRFQGVEVSYEPSPRVAHDLDAFLAFLHDKRSEERQRAAPLFGPHRDHFEVRWQGVELRRRASAGERKAIGILLLAAQAAVLEGRGRRPLVLLDDGDAELDQKTLADLWTLLTEMPQLLVTSNRPDVWHGLAVDHRWEVSAGTLSSL